MTIVSIFKQTSKSRLAKLYNNRRQLHSLCMYYIIHSFIHIHTLTRTSVTPARPAPLFLPNGPSAPLELEMV